jgi:hypothetical protein
MLHASGALRSLESLNYTYVVRGLGDWSGAEQVNG